MKWSISFVLLIIVVAQVQAQTQAVISGRIYNSRNEPIHSASLKIKGTTTGTTADSSGNYNLLTTEKGKKLIEVSSVGYAARELTVVLSDSVIHLDILLKDAARQLGEVIVVGAGTFEASDKAKGASLTPIDAVTVAGSGADIANSLRSLPGAQKIGEAEGLFVRGGTNEEAKQFIDGALMPNPNYSSVPGLLQPARVNPFLFKGILFSTGGYSAQYGQALSGALILETVDLPDRSSAGLSIFPANQSLGFQKLAKDKLSSYGATVNYSNASFYNRVVKQKPDYFHDPEYISGDANFRVKTSKTGMLKFYANYGYSNIGMRNPDIDSSDLISSFQVKGTNFYGNLSYRESFNNNWKLDAVAAYNYYKEDIQSQLQGQDHVNIFIPYDPYADKNRNSQLTARYMQGRVVVSKRLDNGQTIRFGSEYIHSNDHYASQSTAEETTHKLADDLIAAFTEADIYLNRNMAAKVGVRAEYSSLIDNINIAPRLSLAYKLSDGGQINMAYGLFYQKPGNRYLLQNDQLDYARAAHYIINYQKKAANRLFRIEAFYKQYKNLVSTDSLVGNKGNGFARGMELFFRDKRTFKNLDYWISYSYLDTKRQCLDYPYRLQPSYTTPHTFSIAVKKFFPDLNFNVNISYALASGRPYYDMRKDNSDKTIIYDNGTTKMYNSMNLHFAYLFTLFKKWKNKDFSGIGFGANNVFGTKQVFGYNYSYNGLNKVAVTLPAPRYYFIGLFMTFGIDRRNDLMNENL